MRFMVRKLNYAPNVMGTDRVSIAVLLFDESDQGIAAMVRHEFSTVLQRFPSGCVESAEL